MTTIAHWEDAGFRARHDHFRLRGQGGRWWGRDGRVRSAIPSASSPQSSPNQYRPETKHDESGATCGRKNNWRATYAFFVLQKSLARLFLIKILQVSLAEGEHSVNVRLVLHRQLKSSEKVDTIYENNLSDDLMKGAQTGILYGMFLERFWWISHK